MVVVDIDQTQTLIGLLGHPTRRHLVHKVFVGGLGVVVDLVEGAGDRQRDQPFTPEGVGGADPALLVTVLLGDAIRAHL